jgi:hypothetical protein
MASNGPTCVLYVASDAAHLKQVFTGFAMLAKRGIIKLKQQFVGSNFRSLSGVPWSGADAPPTLVASVGGKRICYNTADAGTINRELLASVDYYYKRSYDPAYIRANVAPAEQGKVLPLGLNYAVESSGFDRYRIERARLHRGTARIRSALKGIAIDRVVPGLAATERLTSLEWPPSPEATPRVLFQSRLWDPDAIQDQSQRDVVRQLNERRVLCVKVLREAFGSRFSGGMAREPYAMRHFPESLLPETLSPAKREYLSLLPDHPICVSTTGLQRSIPWKFAEYVAFSRAIVTEKLEYGVPGDFTAGANYLEFETPEQLLSAVTSLVDDPARRIQMMERNREYYRRYLRPDVMVLNSLVNAGVALPSVDLAQ